MKSILEYLNPINEENQSKIDVSAWEAALQSLIGKKIDVSVSGITLPANYFNSGLVGTIIEYYLVKEISSVDIMTGTANKSPLDFTLGETEDSIVYGHPDFKVNGIMAEIKANRNLKRDGIKFTKEQIEKFSKSTPIIWVGYNVSGDSIEITDVKVRLIGDLNINSSGRVYSL